MEGATKRFHLCDTNRGTHSPLKRYQYEYIVIKRKRRRRQMKRWTASIE